MILVVAGKKGSGKDTLADLLVENHNFKKISLADELKILCSRVFEYPINHNYDPNLKEKKWPAPIIITPVHIGRITNYLTTRYFNVTDEMIVDMFNTGENRVLETPRQLLQFIGTDLIRNIVDPDVWIKLTKVALENYEGNAVIPDARFENERIAFKEAGARLALVIRPSVEIEYSADNHMSENQLGGEDDYDILFYNDTDIHQFRNQITLWYMGKERQLLAGR